MKTKKQKIKQQIVAVLVMVFMFVMVSGCYNVSNIFAAEGVNVVLIQNIVAGALNIDSLATLGFNNLTAGVAGNSLGNLFVVNMQDWRGNGQGWKVQAVANNLTTAAAGVNTLANSVIFINTGSLQAVNGATTGMAAWNSQSWVSLDQVRTLVNTTTASNAGMGSYNLANTVINIVFNGRADQVVGTYRNLLTLTIVSN